MCATRAIAIVLQYNARGPGHKHVTCALTIYGNHGLLHQTECQKQPLKQ